jgi:hypothetical protein
VILARRLHVAELAPRPPRAAPDLAAENAALRARVAELEAVLERETAPAPAARKR